jgi:hypothetical protein
VSRPGDQAGEPRATAGPSSPAPRPGRPFPLGATPGEGGTNVAVASDVADAVTLCLFDASGALVLPGEQVTVGPRSIIVCRARTTTGPPR